MSTTASAARAVEVPAVMSTLCVAFGAPAASVAPTLSLETTIVGLGGGGGGGCVTVCVELDESELEQASGLARTHATNDAARASRAETRCIRCGGGNRKADRALVLTPFISVLSSGLSHADILMPARTRRPATP